MPRHAACLALLASLSAMTLAGRAAHAESRVAMVIGNSAYQNVNQLPNPAKDAEAIGEMLKKAGFDVVDSRQNVGVADMKRMIRNFSDKVANADVAVVYYAGHGIEVDGTNYMVPVDAKLERDIDVEDEAVSLDRIVRTLDPAKKLRLVILDACRDNPFATAMKRSISSRGIERGLGKVEPSNPNTLIAYAAKAGSTASDGVGAHSPFTTALLTQLPVPGQDLRKSLGYVRDAVLKATDNKQEPFAYGSLGGDDVALVAAAPKASPVPAQVSALDATSQLRRDYELAAAINTKPAWDAFINNYPKGFYADLARAARSKLDAGTQTVASVDPIGRNTGTNALSAYTGKSFRVTFSERQEELTPIAGKVAYSPRELAVFVQSEKETTSRITQLPNDPARRASRIAHGALGAVDRGLQISFDGKLHLIAMTGGGSYRVEATITENGPACTAEVFFELMPGKTAYEVKRIATGEPVTLKSLTAERLACWVRPGDQASEPPTESTAASATAPHPKTP